MIPPGNCLYLLTIKQSHKFLYLINKYFIHIFKTKYNLFSKLRILFYLQVSIKKNAHLSKLLFFINNLKLHFKNSTTEKKNSLQSIYK